MNTKNYTDEYDNEFEKINIYGRYNFLIPFVGKNFSVANKKVLFLGESHFLPKKAYKRINKDELLSWYGKNQEDYKFTGEEESHLNTLNIISNDVINSGYQNKSHSIYRNLGNEYADCFDLTDYNDALPHISFFNYFLRPAEEEGGSIKVNWKDDVFSFNHLFKIENILKPSAIIFASTLARKSFHRVRNCNDNDYKIKGEYLEKKIFDIPHPGSAWWNREFKINKNEFWNSKINSITKDKINGRNKLRLILESL